MHRSRINLYAHLCTLIKLVVVGGVEEWKPGWGGIRELWEDEGVIRLPPADEWGPQ